MAVFWALFAAAYVAMSVYDKCSREWWAVFIGLYPILIAVTIGGGYLVKRHAARREASHVSTPKGEVIWSGQKLAAGPLAAICVGLVAGLLGLGGGELMAPLLLELGLMPKAASSTSAYMIIWTTSSNMVHYGVGHSLIQGYAVCFCLLGFVGGLGGRYLAINFIKGRQSPIAFFLGTVLALSMLLMAYRVASNQPNDAWGPMHFSDLC